jgi:hypothetical protein
MGGLVGGKGGSPDTVDTTTTASVSMPSWLEPAYQNIVGGAGQLYAQGGQQYFPNQGYVPLSEASQQGLSSMYGLAADPSQIPGYGQTFDTFANTVGGGYMNANPYVTGEAWANNPTIAGEYLYGGEGFNAALDAANRKILPQVKSQFGTSGRTSSALAMPAMTEALGDVFAGMYGQERQHQENAYRDMQRNQLGAYGQERGMMQQALGMAPSMYQLAMAPGQTMMGVGQTQENEQQRALQDQMARWQFEQNAPYQNLAQYAGAVNPVGQTYAGRSTTSQQPVYDSGGAGLLGSALSLGSMFLPGIGGAASSMFGGGLSGLAGGGLAAPAIGGGLAGANLPIWT